MTTKFTPKVITRIRKTINVAQKEFNNVVTDVGLFTESDKILLDALDEIEKLQYLLRFALNNLRLNIPSWDISGEECEYDFCVVCGNPEWNHKDDCNGIKWINETNQALKD